MEMYDIITLLGMILVPLIQVEFGFPNRSSTFPKDIDFYYLTNEDIGFTTSLTTGANDVYAFALPYPSSIDLFRETIVVHALEFIYQRSHEYKADTTVHQLMAYLSYLDKEFPATFRGEAVDTVDEALKAQLAGPIVFGREQFNIVATASVEGGFRKADSIRDAMYVPPLPLDLLTPLYVQFVNNSVAVTLATNNEAAADFDVEERVAMRVWFTRRNLTEAEKSARAMSVRFQRLDS